MLVKSIWFTVYNDAVEESWISAYKIFMDSMDNFVVETDFPNNRNQSILRSPANYALTKISLSFLSLSSFTAWDTYKNIKK